MNVSVYSREAIEKLIADGNFPAHTAAVREFFNHDGIEIFSNYAYYPNQVIYHKVYEALCRQAGLP